MYCLSTFCFVCLSMDKKKKLNKISDLSIFNMLNSCSYDTKWMEDTFTMHMCRKCHNQLYSVSEFIEMCRKNSSLLQGYVELLKHPSNDIGEPIDRLKEREMVMKVLIDLDTVENKLEDDTSAHMISVLGTMTDPIRELSLKDELDADMSFMNVNMDIKHEPVILKSDIDSESDHVLDQMMEFDAETDSKQHLMLQPVVGNYSDTSSICKNIKIEHIRDENEILVTNVFDEDNISTQFSSHSDSIFINNIIENSAVPINKLNLRYQTETIDQRMCSEIQRSESDPNFKIKLPVCSNVSEIAKGCLVRKGAAAQDQPDKLSIYSENSLNQKICSAQSKVDSAGFGLKPINNKVTSDNPVKRVIYNGNFNQTKSPVATDKMFYIVLPIEPNLSTQPAPNIPVIDTVPAVNKTIVKKSIQNGIPIAATNSIVKNYRKRKMEPPRKCDICQKTCDTHADLRLHLVTHSGMKTVTPEKTRMEEQRTQSGVGINKNETYETMFIKHMVRTGSL